MASILQVGDKWRAQVRRRHHKPQTKTFRTRREAEQWAREIEGRIDKGAEPREAAGIRLHMVIEEYRRLREDGGRPIDPCTNVHYMLQHLEQDLGAEKVTALTPARLVQWATARKNDGAGPFTINMELSALGTCLRHAASFMNIVFPDVVGQARPLLHHLQLIGGGNRRTRRLTDDELAAILAHVHQRDPRVADAMRVAAITGLRRSELVLKLRWDSLDARKRAALIRQRKHPRRQLARDEWVPLLGDAWEIVQRQPHDDDRVFPISPEKITDYFTAAVRACGVPDARLHDLRHTAASALQERGFDEAERMAITGHRDSKVHARYVHPSLDHLHAKFDAETTHKRPAAPRKRPRT
jgi:integrase